MSRPRCLGMSECRGSQRYSFVVGSDCYESSPIQRVIIVGYLLVSVTSYLVILFNFVFMTLLVSLSLRFYIIYKNGDFLFSRVDCDDCVIPDSVVI